MSTATMLNDKWVLLELQGKLGCETCESSLQRGHGDGVAGGQPGAHWLRLVPDVNDIMITTMVMVRRKTWMMIPHIKKDIMITTMVMMIPHIKKDVNNSLGRERSRLQVQVMDNRVVGDV